ncbi:unnamed protein product, partial [marine sediment metagenome]
MSVGFIFVLMLAAAALVVLVALLASAKTRPIALLMLGVPAVLFLGLVLLRGGAVLAIPGRLVASSWIVLVLGLLALGGIAALLSLLFNEKTRPIGLALLAVPAVLAALVLLGAIFFYPLATRQRNVFVPEVRMGRP